MAGYSHANFSGDTNGFGAENTWPLSRRQHLRCQRQPSSARLTSYAQRGLRLAPEYFATGYGSSMQNSLGFTGGIVYRFGKR